MFKRNTTTDMAKQPETMASAKVNTIVEGTRIEGVIQSEGNFRIDGFVKGEIQIKGKLIIGPSGEVEGRVSCQNAEVEGSFKGVFEVQQLLYLKSTARIFGDSVFSKLRVEEGAQLECTCNYNANASQAKEAIIKDLKHGGEQRATQTTERAAKEERTA
ncbi:MAG: polymer-forming cytoskeletal protein [Cryomorphaceae bacterium]|nr:MAG: polymer-forming cytoskeletal protein [Cryomorphaceae bacterium]